MGPVWNPAFTKWCIEAGLDADTAIRDSVRVTRLGYSTGRYRVNYAEFVDGDDGPRYKPRVVDVDMPTEPPARWMFLTEWTAP